MFDRKSQPVFKTKEDIEIKKIKKINLKGNLPFYILDSGDQDIIKIDFIFKAGKIYDKNPLLAEITNSLSIKGTERLSSEKISNTFDYYGSYIETDIGKDEASITLYCLNKYFKESFNLLTEILFNANFPQNEIDIFLKNEYQIWLINRQKTDIISSELFTETIFNAHSYGRIVKKEDFNSISKENIISFFNSYYKPENMTILLSGKIQDNHILSIENFISSLTFSEFMVNNLLSFETEKYTKEHIFQPIKNSVQSSVRIGKLTINRLHPDFYNLNFACVILGGYFGSRLMTNIREEKGYTYGIYSGNVSYLNAGYFLISAESGKNVYKNALKEIYKELKLLRTVPVSQDELVRVKNWFFGNILRIFDGPLALSEAYKSLISYNSTSDFFLNYFSAVQNISSETILETADKYLQENDMTEVVSGA
ncbi:MAG: insulinase family protein [Chlorobi bacterium]|nr:insulinase family protein [Chlorobiota bacterium]